MSFDPARTLADFRDRIRQHGWIITGDADNLVFYTAGLTALGLPELLMRKMPTPVAHLTLNTLAGRSMVEGRLHPNLAETVEGIFGLEFRVRELPWGPQAPIRGGLLHSLYPHLPISLQEVHGVPLFGKD